MTKPKVAIFRHNPQASGHCTDALIKVLSTEYDINIINVNQLKTNFLRQFSCLIFPGGVGEARVWRKLLKPHCKVIQKYVARGGHYLGICMGAYWADSRHFNILNGIVAEQYIKLPDAEIRRSYPTCAEVKWRGEEEHMYFYDGPTFFTQIRDKSFTPTEIVATYQNGSAMALLQGRVGVIGCHPESMQSWYAKPYMNRLWHEKEHHDLLIDFLLNLLKI